MLPAIIARFSLAYSEYAYQLYKLTYSLLSLNLSTAIHNNNKIVNFEVINGLETHSVHLSSNTQNQSRNSMDHSVLLSNEINENDSFRFLILVSIHSKVHYGIVYFAFVNFM